MSNFGGIDETHLTLDVLGLLALVTIVALYLVRAFRLNASRPPILQYGKLANSPILQYFEWSIGFCMKQIKTNCAFVAYLVTVKVLLHNRTLWVDYCVSIAFVIFTVFRLRHEVFDEFVRRPAIRPGFLFLSMTAIILLGPLVRVLNVNTDNFWDVVSSRWETVFLLIYPSAAAVWLLTAANRVIHK